MTWSWPRRRDSNRRSDAVVMRRRRGGVARYPRSPQRLEPRLPLAAELSIGIEPALVVPGEAIAVEVRYLQDNGTTGQEPQAGGFGDLIGPSLFTTQVNLQDPRGAIFAGESFQVYGQHNSQAAIQVGGGEIVPFDSIRGDDNPTGRIYHATELLDGSVVYVGSSAGLLGSNQPTYWFGSTQVTAQRNTVGTLSSGTLYAVSETGIAVGTSGGVVATYAHLGSNFETFPGFGSGLPVGISRDGVYVTGSNYVWRQNEFGGYSVLDTSDWEPAISGAVAGMLGVEVDAQGRAFFGGGGFNLDDARDYAAFYDDTGRVLGVFPGSFAGLAYVDGEVLGAVEGYEEGILVRLSDGSVITTTELVGVWSNFVRDGGIFSTEGAFGMLLYDWDYLPFVSIHETSIDGAPIPGPESVDLWVDSTGDGEYDLIFPDTDLANFQLSFPRAGSYTVSVLAMNGTEEVARATTQVEVSAYRFAERAGTSVLVIGADQDQGSTVRVTVRGERSWLVIDDLDEELSGDLAIGLVEVIGSPLSDHVTLDGPFAAVVDLRGGDDTLVIIGLSDFEVVAGEGDGPALFVAASPLQNAWQVADVDGDGAVSPLDALLILNQLARSARSGLSDAEAFERLLDDPDRHYFDVDGNGRIEPLDALLVLNHIARTTGPVVESESHRLAGPLSARRTDEALVQLIPEGERRIGGAIHDDGAERFVGWDWVRRQAAEVGSAERSSTWQAQPKAGWGDG